MHIEPRFALAVLALLAPGGGVLAQLPALPELPASVDAVVYAESFRVDESFTFTWSADRPTVTEGTIVVLEADPALVRRRDAAEPVLYVGSHVAWRVAENPESGRLIAFVPARVDLETARVFFGSPGLPERVDRRQIGAEILAASSAGIVPLPREMVRSARRRGGEGRRFATRASLLSAMRGIAAAHGALAPVTSSRSERQPRL